MSKKGGLGLASGVNSRTAVASCSLKRMPLAAAAAAASAAAAARRGALAGAATGAPAGRGAPAERRRQHNIRELRSMPRGGGGGGGGGR